jgi:hypothetical protein
LDDFYFTGLSDFGTKWLLKPLGFVSMIEIIHLCPLNQNFVVWDEVYMKKYGRPLTAFIALVFAMLACSSSFQVMGTPVPPAEQGTTTIVATSLLDEILPHAFYYLGIDNSTGLSQVFRIERDGKTQTQLTSELVNVLDYDISLADGHIAYEVDNQLILVNADGSNRQVLTEGPTRSVARGYYNPVFSPDGQTLAYNEGGLLLYTLSTGASNLVLEDRPLGGSLPPEIYTPDKFAPDGTKLLINIGHPPDSPWTAAIYFLTTNTLTRIGGESEPLSCCTMYGGAEWSADSSNLYAVATMLDSSTPFGALWNIDAATGTVTTLIPGTAGEGDTLLFYQIYKPHMATTGQLYFFSAKYPEFVGPARRVPLIPIRTMPDDITTNWTVMRGDTFEMMNEALWAPDANFVVVAYAPMQDVYEGGQAEIVYLDGKPNMVLTTFAQQMKWGP